MNRNLKFQMHFSPISLFIGSADFMSILPEPLQIRIFKQFSAVILPGVLVTICDFDKGRECAGGYAESLN
jgi:hypothetical protein